MIQNSHPAALATTKTALTDYERSVEIACSVEKAFSFCASRAGFEAHFPHVVDRYVGNETWSVGDAFKFRYRYFGMWFRWAGRITKLEENVIFQDEMNEGLFATFLHTHRFEKLGEDRTRYTDSIQFTLGLGSFVDRAIGKRLVDVTFAKRHDLLKRALEG